MNTHGFLASLLKLLNAEARRVSGQDALRPDTMEVSIKYE